MSLIQTAIALVIAAVLAAVGLVGGTAIIHSSKVTAIKTEIQAVATKSTEYANINGSYSGLSCAALVNDNLEPANDCNGSGYFNSALSEGELTVAPSSTNAGFIISFTPTDPSLTVIDCSGPISGSLGPSLSSYSCTAATWSFTYGN